MIRQPPQRIVDDDAAPLIAQVREQGIGQGNLQVDSGRAPDCPQKVLGLPSW
jgi:hypothetical protein